MPLYVLTKAAYIVPALAGTLATQVTAAGGQTAGRVAFDPSKYGPPFTLKFKVVLEATAGMTAEVFLYNISTGATVTSSTLSTASTTPVELSATLTIGASPNVPNADQLYQVQVRISAGVPGPTDFATLTSAVLEIDTPT